MERPTQYWYRIRSAKLWRSRPVPVQRLPVALDKALEGDWWLCAHRCPNGWDTLIHRNRDDLIRSLQLGVFGLGSKENGYVGGGVFPKRPEILI
jgi:hypothetical protein